MLLKEFERTADCTEAQAESIRRLNVGTIASASSVTPRTEPKLPSLNSGVGRLALQHVSSLAKCPFREHSRAKDYSAIYKHPPQRPNCSLTFALMFFTVEA